MSIKERLVNIARAQGYDFMTACEIASDAIQRAKTAPNTSSTFTLGNVSFTLQRNA